ncbi:hypothetical protein CLV59_109241 [Chitinophaga dinghuensis]|uniref:Uncharacterized protein n=1 Tax=Chitinophaga dinghuensis TaxID=1539050 RepID=A0A327VQG9_9BACT|nr:hypothetical protein CLV59_109241 [Chitinophaga dinghuensis]
MNRLINSPIYYMSKSKSALIIPMRYLKSIIRVKRVCRGGIGLMYIKLLLFSLILWSCNSVTKGPGFTFQLLHVMPNDTITVRVNDSLVFHKVYKTWFDASNGNRLYISRPIYPNKIVSRVQILVNGQDTVFMVNRDSIKSVCVGYFYIRYEYDEKVVCRPSEIGFE